MTDRWEENGTIDLLRAHLRKLDEEFKEYKEKTEREIEKHQAIMMKFQDKMGWIYLIFLFLAFFAGMNSTVTIVKFLAGKP